MKNLNFLFICLFSLLIVGCGKNSDNTTEPIPFRVDSSIAALTRSPQLDESGAGNFTKGDQNTLFIQTSGKAPKQFTYTYGNAYTWFDLQLSEGVSSVMISAMYPAKEVATPQNYEFDVETMQEELLVANPVEATVNSPKAIKLTFHHILHKFEVNLSSKDASVSRDMLTQAEITLKGYQPIAVIDLLEAKATGAKGATKSTAQSGDKFMKLIPSQQVGNMEVSVRIAERTFTQKLSECQVNGSPLTELKSGQTFRLNITVNKESFSVEGSQIEGWGDQGSHDGEIII